MFNECTVPRSPARHIHTLNNISMMNREFVRKWAVIFNGKQSRKVKRRMDIRLHIAMNLKFIKSRDWLFGHTKEFSFNWELVFSMDECNFGLYQPTVVTSLHLAKSNIIFVQIISLIIKKT